VNVYLVGMPGSGKSSVGRELARLLNRPFVDLDAEVEAQTGRPIPELFESDGEAAFRLAESRALASVARAHAVVSCGGGVVLDPSNRALLVSSGVVVYLEASLETLRARVGTGDGRPLLRDGGGGPEVLERLLADREPLYRELARSVVSSEAEPASVAAEIAEVVLS
jgi:shikimate kinase